MFPLKPFGDLKRLLGLCDRGGKVSLCERRLGLLEHRLGGLYVHALFLKPGYIGLHILQDPQRFALLFLG